MRRNTEIERIRMSGARNKERGYVRQNTTGEEKKENEADQRVGRGWRTTINWEYKDGEENTRRTAGI